MRNTNLDQRLVLSALYAAAKGHFRHVLPWNPCKSHLSLLGNPVSKYHRLSLKVYYFKRTSLCLTTVGNLCILRPVLSDKDKKKTRDQYFYEYRYKYAKQNTSKPNPAA